MRIARRTLRTAALATGTIAALSLPAAAFADDGPAPVTQEEQQGQQQVDPPVERAFVQSYRLADGSVAKVYRTGTGEYAAEIWAGGTLLDTLTSTGGRAAYGENNGLHVVLDPDGSVRSWTDRVPTPDPKPTPEPKPTPKPKPKPKPAPHQADARVTLPDGTVAKLYEKGARVEFRFGSISARNPTLSHHGWTYEIVPQGRNAHRFVVVDAPEQGANSWVYDFDGRLVASYEGQQRSHTVVVPRGTVPKGAVRAGAENVAEGTHHAALIGAGGGMAALGAAGLGCALFHRRTGRQDG
ncbi:hypothetical protein [Streptomyces sp. NBC_01268]|uniref:hypothetical protein n=1 Tax=Streptomyces sp. NBC_01268 TaxID=2903806 RepID=UPI002E34065B|nr:hypothetical protein [Streptomyces sp. NBC_01268]